MAQLEPFGLVVLGAFVGCAPPSLNVGAEIPSRIDRVAAVMLDARGQVTGGTGLFGAERIRDQLAVLASEPDDVARIVVVGWKDDTLLSATGRALPSDEQLVRSPLVPGDASKPILPAPDFTAEAELPGTGIAIVSPTPGSFELHASWLPPCPSLTAGGRPIVDSCSKFFCGDRFTQNGCLVDVELGGCLPGAPNQLVVGPRGELSGDNGTFHCTPSSTDDDSAGGFKCNDCVVEVHRPPFHVPFEVTAPISVVPVVDPAARLHPLVLPVDGNLIGIASVGPATDPCSFPGPRIVALTRLVRGQCDTGQELVVIDPESTRELGRGPVAGGCARAVYPDPSGSGVLVVGDHPLTIRRYACDLSQLDNNGFSLPGLDDAYIFASAYMPAGDGAPARFVLAMGGGGLAGMSVAEVDPVTFAASLAIEVPDLIEVFDMAVFGATQVAMGTREGPADNSFFWVRSIDFRTSPATSVVSQNRGGGLLATASRAISALPSSGRFVTSSPDSDANVYGVVRIGGPGATLETEVVDFTFDGSSPSGTHVWRGAPGAVTADRFVLVATTLEGPGRLPETRIGLVDVERGRFLPGRQKIGYGPVGRIAEDQSGALWLPLVWQGALVRVRPSEPKVVTSE